MKKIVKWGILATGKIATKFASDLRGLEDAELYAVASRSKEKAEEFGEKFGIPVRYGSYAELAADPEVDVVYIASLHPFHMENALQCLRNKKAVLCEKPIAMNSRQLSEMIRTAEGNRVFLMEGMWARFHPITGVVRQWLKEKRIGDIQMVKADFCFRSQWNPQSRLLSKELGGGALLDVGIYVTSYASMILGAHPASIQAKMCMGETGVDEQTGVLLGYENGAMAVLTCGVRTRTPNEACIIGTDGYIRVPTFWHASRATLSVQGKEDETVEIPLTGNGYGSEAREVTDCIRQGKLQSDLMPLQESKDIMKILDTIREQNHLVYPCE